MEILVCVKQVPDTAEVKIDPVKHTVIRAGVPNIFNPFDQNALEAALQMKDADKDVKITLLSMGPDQAKDVLREGLAMGADDAYLLSDRKLGGSDTLATGYALAQAIKKVAADKGIEQFDIILCGKQAIDGDTAQVGPQIACELGIPQITYARDIKVEGNKVTVQQENEEGYIVTEANFPVLITAVKDLNETLLLLQLMTLRSVCLALRLKSARFSHRLRDPVVSFSKLKMTTNRQSSTRLWKNWLPRKSFNLRRNSENGFSRI